MIEKLGVEIFELKWGQGAKDIGGEVKLSTMERSAPVARTWLHVLPDPSTAAAEKAFESGGISEFERHSRLGMVTEEGFYKEVERLRSLGAKYVTLKTRSLPARGSGARNQILIKRRNRSIDDRRSRGRHGNESMADDERMGHSHRVLESLTYRMCEQLKAQGNYVPPIAIAGGMSLEDHIFKALALGAPYVKAICLGRALMAAAMVGKTNGKSALEKDQTEDQKDSERVFLSLFAVGAQLKERFGSEFKLIPAGAIGMYSYVDRLKQGLQQLMAGARKFALPYIDRNDLVSLTREATDVSGIPYVMESDQRLAESIISGNGQPSIFVAKSH